MTSKRPRGRGTIRSSTKIYMNYVLEHLVAMTVTSFAVLQEFFRVRRGGRQVTIAVPHPRYDGFLHDATHERAVTVVGLSVFSRKNCEEWIAAGNANTPLAFVAGVDFEIVESEITLEESYKSKFDLGVLSKTELMQAIRLYNNAIKETKIVFQVVKG